MSRLCRWIASLVGFGDVVVGASDGEESNGDDETGVELFVAGVVVVVLTSLLASFRVNRLAATLERRLICMNVDSGLVLRSAECCNFNGGYILAHRAK